MQILFQNCSFLRIWSHLLKKSLMENFIFCAVQKTYTRERLFESQFSYCPLIWMCHSCTNNRKINSLYEIYLRIIYNDKQSLFSKLLENDGSASIPWGVFNLWPLKWFLSAEIYCHPSWMAFSNKRTTVAVSWDKFLNFQDRWWSHCTMEAKVFHF